MMKPAILFTKRWSVRRILSRSAFADADEIKVSTLFALAFYNSCYKDLQNEGTLFCIRRLTYDLAYLIATTIKPDELDDDELMWTASDLIKQLSTEDENKLNVYMHHKSSAIYFERVIAFILWLARKYESADDLSVAFAALMGTTMVACAHNASCGYPNYRISVGMMQEEAAVKILKILPYETEYPDSYLLSPIEHAIDAINCDRLMCRQEDDSISQDEYEIVKAMWQAFQNGYQDGNKELQEEAVSPSVPLDYTQEIPDLSRILGESATEDAPTINLGSDQIGKDPFSSEEALKEAPLEAESIELLPSWVKSSRSEATKI